MSETKDERFEIRVELREGLLVEHLLQQDKARLAKEMEKLEKDLKRVQGKLGNSAFVDKAPAEVVEKEREKMQAQEQALQQLQEQEQRIRQM